MRKIISLAVALVVLLQAFCASFAVISAESNADEIDITKEMHVLKRLGIIDVDLTDDTTASVSRATLADYIAKAMKLDTSGNDRFFSDVSAQHWALGSIGALVKADIISGTAANRFEPERDVTYAEACKMLVSAAGYGIYVEYLGGGLNEYIRFANKIGISIEPENVESLRLDEIIYMLYETMAVPMVYEYSVVDDEVIYNVRDDKTLFLVYYDTYITKGRVETVYGKSLYNALSSEKSETVIDGTRYLLDSGYNISNLFGHSVEYVYIKAPDAVRGTVIYAEKYLDDEAETITSDLIVGFDTGKYALAYEHGKKSTITYAPVARGARVILNGRIMQGSLREQIKLFADGTRKGTVTLIKTDNDASADLVIIDSKRIFTVSAHNTGDEILYSKYGDTPIKLKEYEVVNVHTTEGADAAFPVAFPAPLGVAESDDGQVIDITVYNEQIEKQIENIYGSKHEVVIDGQKYKIDDTLYPRISSTLKSGQLCRAVIDEFGEIVMMLSLTDVMQLGYLRGVAEVGDAFAKDFKVSIYMTDMVFHEYDLADRVKIDGVTYKLSDYQRLFGAFPGQKIISEDKVTLERQIIRFSLNSNGEINVIDTYSLGNTENADNTLERRADGSKMLYHAKPPKKLGLADVYDANTSIFVVPETAFGSSATEDIKEYAAGAAYLREYGSYKAETYYMGESSAVATAVVCMMEPGNLCEDVFMFDNLLQEYDADEGAVIERINGWLKGAIVTYNVSESAQNDANALSQGDLYYVELDVTGKAVISITKMIDEQEKTFNSDPASRENASNDGSGGLNKYWWSGNFAYPEQWRANARQLIKIYPHDINGTYIRGSYTMENVRREIIDDVTNLSALPITVYDSDNEYMPIYKGTLADIKTYQNDTEDCSMVIIHTRHQDLKQIFVYR